MWMKLRVLWYLNIRKQSHLPRDVREHILRTYLKSAIAALKTPEEKLAFQTELVTGTLGLKPDDISAELMYRN
jgi:hypothetical protein